VEAFIGVGDRSNVTVRKKFVKKLSGKDSIAIKGGLEHFNPLTHNPFPSNVFSQIEPPLSPRELRAQMLDMGVP